MKKKSVKIYLVAAFVGIALSGCMSSSPRGPEMPVESDKRSEKPKPSPSTTDEPREASRELSSTDSDGGSKEGEPKIEQKGGTDSLEEGRGAFENQNYKKAYELLFPLALKGNPKAQTYVGQLFMYQFTYEQPVVELNVETAASWLRKAATQGEPQAMYHLGKLYLDCRQPFCSEEEGLKWHEKSATLGYVPSQLAIGSYYYQKPFLQGADEKTLYWFGKAAKQGSIEAKIALGKAFLVGVPVERDYSKALSYLTDVVNQQNTKPINTDTSEAKYLLGRMYAQGLGVPRDEARAFDLFQAAIVESNEAQNAGQAGNPEVAEIAKQEMEQLGMGGQEVPQTGN